MEVLQAIGAIIVFALWIGATILGGFFIYWTGRILSILPDRITRITVAFEKIANKH